MAEALEIYSRKRCMKLEHQIILSKLVKIEQLIFFVMQVWLINLLKQVKVYRLVSKTSDE